MSNIAKIKEYCVANGEGLRTAVFFSGCPHKCKECFNQELWDYNYGERYTSIIEEKILNTINNHIKGLSILGGEPLCKENYNTVLNLCKKFKEKFPHKDIWLWTGYKIENIINTEIFNYIDVLIDGKFEIENKNYNLKWRGSSNQRILYRGKDF